jgi:hypothetical protein
VVWSEAITLRPQARNIFYITDVLGARTGKRSSKTPAKETHRSKDPSDTEDPA